MRHVIGDSDSRFDLDTPLSHERAWQWTIQVDCNRLISANLDARLFFPLDVLIIAIFTVDFYLAIVALELS